MMNTTYCDVCNHEYKCYKKHFKHTFNLFRQISLFYQETKHCERCDNDILQKNYNKHFQSRKHKNNEEREGATKFSIENTDVAFKGHIKIRLFRFEDPGPSSINEAVDMVKQSIETVIKNTLSEMKTLKFYIGVKLNMAREGGETTPYMRTNPHFIT